MDDAEAPDYPDNNLQHLDVADDFPIPLDQIFMALMALQMVNTLRDLPRKTTVTVSLLVLNLCIFAFPLIILHLPDKLFSWFDPVIQAMNPENGCLLPGAIFSGHSYRLLTASFLHVSEMHLIFNMGSLLDKGASLEPIFGTFGFVYLLIFLSIVSELLYVLLAHVLALVYSDFWLHTCTVGFSNVLFGMAAVLDGDPRFEGCSFSLFNFTVAANIAPWIELVMVMVVTPGPSILPHLCGLCAGYLFVFCAKYAGPVFTFWCARLREVREWMWRRVGDQIMRWGMGAMRKIRMWRYSTIETEDQEKDREMRRTGSGTVARSEGRTDRKGTGKWSTARRTAFRRKAVRRAAERIAGEIRGSLDNSEDDEALTRATKRRERLLYRED